MAASGSVSGAVQTKKLKSKKLTTLVCCGPVSVASSPVLAQPT